MTATQRLLAYQFPACAEQMGSVRLKLREALKHYGGSEAVLNNVVLAVGEACMNIIQHAYGPNDKGDIVLEVDLKSLGFVQFVKWTMFLMKIRLKETITKETITKDTITSLEVV